jgi:hypothetical protein
MHGKRAAIAAVVLGGKSMERTLRQMAGAVDQHAPAA